MPMQNIPPKEGTSIIFVFDYFIGLGIFGIVYGILNGVVAGVRDSSFVSNVVVDYANMMWTGALIIYIIAGLFWLPLRIREFRR
jgi:uncharacterized membrane protein